MASLTLIRVAVTAKPLFFAAGFYCVRRFIIL